MIELINLNDWKKQKDILYELHREYGINISSREWRNQVEKWNKKFADGEVNTYITHSNSKGFKETRDYQEALLAMNDFKKRATNMFHKIALCKKGFERINNYEIDFEKGNLK